MTVPVGVFSALFIVAAAAMAVWVVVRFSDRAPSEFRRALVHLGLSTVVMYVAVPILQNDLAFVSQPFRLHLSLFAVLLPALVYRFVAMIWLLRLAQGALRSALR